MKEGFTFQCLGCWKLDCVTGEIARLTGLVKGMEMRMNKKTDGIESDDRERGRKEQCKDKTDEKRRLRGGRGIARKRNGERTTENMTRRKVTGEKVTVYKEGGRWDMRGETYM